ncbi:MAG: hypothetical protein R3E21_09225 [Caenibius sp.]
MAEQPELFTTEDPAIHTGPDGQEHALQAEVHHDDGGAHAGPSSFGLGPSGWVGLSMLAFILILLWKKVPALLAGGLDARIAEIKKQLDEAKALRAEAEALRQEYSDKIASAEKDAAAMLEHAQKEADAIVTKAESDAEAMVERRKKMAEEKIAATERSVVDELRAKAASAAAVAARGLISGKHDAAADTKLVDAAIADI